jgi:hypothetical protein
VNQGGTQDSGQNTRIRALYGEALAAAVASCATSPDEYAPVSLRVDLGERLALTVKCAVPVNRPGRPHSGSAPYCGQRIAAVVRTEQGPLFWGRHLDQARDSAARSRRALLGVRYNALVPPTISQTLLLSPQWRPLTSTEDLSGFCEKDGARPIDREELVEALKSARSETHA